MLYKSYCHVIFHNNCISLQGELACVVISEESLWTLGIYIIHLTAALCVNYPLTAFIEDRKMIRIVLVKSSREAKNCWRSLLVGAYDCNPLMFDQMEKKMALERYQREVRPCASLVFNIIVFVLRIQDLISAGLKLLVTTIKVDQICPNYLHCPNYLL